MKSHTYATLSKVYYSFLITAFIMVLIGAKLMIKIFSIEDLSRVCFNAYYPIILYVVIGLTFIDYLLLLAYDVKNGFFQKLKKRSLALAITFLLIVLIIFTRL